MTAEQLCYESLRFRNQFILGPWPALEDLPGWQHVPIRGTWHIAAHPELRTVTRSRDGLEVVLLGTLLDPDSVGDSDEVILNRLLGPSGGARDILRRIREIGGSLDYRGVRRYRFNPLHGCARAATGGLYVGRATDAVGCLASRAVAATRDLPP